MKRLAFIFAAALALAACSSNKNNNGTVIEEDAVQEQMVGAFGEQREITEEEMAMFRKATENDSLAVYTPLSVSTQVVAGTNYKFWCRFEETSDKYGHCWITIFKPLSGQGEPEVTSIEPQVSE